MASKRRTVVEPGRSASRQLGPISAGLCGRILALEGAPNTSTHPAGLNYCGRSHRRPASTISPSYTGPPADRSKADPHSTGCLNMELVSITLARVVAMIQFQQWDPFGASLTLEALAKLAGRYSFTKGPTKLEDLDGRA